MELNNFNPESSKSIYTADTNKGIVTEIIISVDGSKYDLLKKKFKNLRDEYKLHSISGGGEDRHTWTTDNVEEAIVCEYFRKEDKSLESTKIIWSGRNVSGLLMSILHLFVNETKVGDKK